MNKIHKYTKTKLKTKQSMVISFAQMNLSMHES